MSLGLLGYWVTGLPILGGDSFFGRLCFFASGVLQPLPIKRKSTPDIFLKYLNGNFQTFYPAAGFLDKSLPSVGLMNA